MEESQGVEPTSTTEKKKRAPRTPSKKFMVYHPTDLTLVTDLTVQQAGEALAGNNSLLVFQLDANVKGYNLNPSHAVNEKFKAKTIVAFEA